MLHIFYWRTSKERSRHQKETKTPWKNAGTCSKEGWEHPKKGAGPKRKKTPTRRKEALPTDRSRPPKERNQRPIESSRCAKERRPHPIERSQSLKRKRNTQDMRGQQGGFCKHPKERRTRSEAGPHNPQQSQVLGESAGNPVKGLSPCHVQTTRPIE